MRPLVFITGASSGIGQALALRYHQAGWRLALAARRVPEMQVWLDAQGIPVEIAQCYGADVSDANSIIAAGRADLCAIARPHLADPAWTLHEAAKLQSRAVVWPRQYESGRDQLYRELAKQQQMAASAPVKKTALHSAAQEEGL